jgi:hypothetical protein
MPKKERKQTKGPETKPKTPNRQANLFGRQQVAGTSTPLPPSISSRDPFFQSR